MSPEESMSLYIQGKDSWNEWANRLLAERAELEASGQWKVEMRLDPWLADVDLVGINGDSIAWLGNARVDFSGHTFHNQADFIEFIFPGTALFLSSKFPTHTRFRKATFYNTVSFENAEFTDLLLFDQITFKRRATFRGTSFLTKYPSGLDGNIFEQDVSFIQAKFNEVSFLKTEFHANAYFHDARFKVANFSNAAFKGESIFTSSEFGGKSDFKRAVFTKKVLFNGTKFYKVDFDNSLFAEGVDFSRAEFEDDVTFTRSEFRPNADYQSPNKSKTSFENTAFKRKAGFNKAHFDHISFNHAHFDYFADFSEATFHCTADFGAVQGNGGFSLRDATFHSVPDFKQAHFAEAPDLDDIRLPSTYWEASKWRALRRMATQGHDHQNEQQFFIKEIKSRLRQDWTWRYLGIPYELFSNYGQSAFRPIIWWLIIMIGATFYFFNYHLKTTYVNGSLVQWSQGNEKIAPFADLPCVDGTDNAQVAALYLAMHHGLVLSGLGKNNKLEQSYACLYGGRASHPIMPNAVVFTGILQTLLSAILIFLMLLAVRNYFKIK